MGEIRAFVAVELPFEIKVELSGLIEKLQINHSKTVKWVKPEGIHLTLKFLGNISEEKLFDINNSLVEVASRSFPFDLYLDKVGAFPNLRAPRVAWVGISGDIPDLMNVHRHIENCLSPIGFMPDNKPYSGHLTIGRVRDRAGNHEKVMLGRELSELQVRQTLVFHVDSYSLMKSTLTPSGAIYQQLNHFTLDKN